MDLGINLEPLFVDDKLGVPFYSNNVPIHLNVCGFSCDYDGQDKLADDLQIPYASLTRIKSCRLMYWECSTLLTDPPISTLALQVIGPPESLRGPMHVTLRAVKGSGGISFGDLLDVFDKMRAYDTKLSLAGWDFAAWFATKGDEINYDSICERGTRNRIEVRKCNGKDE